MTWTTKIYYSIETEELFLDILSIQRIRDTRKIYKVIDLTKLSGMTPKMKNFNNKYSNSTVRAI